MDAPYGQPVEKEPSRYELRIGDYLAAIGIDESGRQSIWGRIGSHKLLLGRTVKDIFLDDAKTSGGERAAMGDLWIFTSDSISRHHRAAGKSQFEFMAHRDVRFVELTAQDSDIFSVGAHSAITMSVEFTGGRTAVLSATGKNSLYLLIAFRKYFSRRMAP